MMPIHQPFRSGHVARRFRSRRGFTLVEVLTAATLMAIVLPVAMYGVQISLQASTAARREAEAATLGEGKIQELASMAELPQVAAASNDSGDFGADFPDYKWQSTVTTLDLSMEQIDVKVSWSSRNQQRDMTFSTWVFLSNGATATSQ